MKKIPRKNENNCLDAIKTKNDEIIKDEQDISKFTS